MARRVEVGWQRLVFQGLQHLLAIVEEGVEGGSEDSSEPPACEQLLEEVGGEHEHEVRLGRHRIVTVHVFQSEATVLGQIGALCLVVSPIREDIGGQSTNGCDWGG